MWSPKRVVLWKPKASLSSASEKLPSELWITKLRLEGRYSEGVAPHILPSSHSLPLSYFHLLCLRLKLGRFWEGTTWMAGLPWVKVVCFCLMETSAYTSTVLGSCVPWGKGRQLHPMVDSTASHHQNKNTTVLIAMESSILLSGIGTDWNSRGSGWATSYEV